MSTSNYLFIFIVNFLCFLHPSGMGVPPTSSVVQSRASVRIRMDGRDCCLKITIAAFNIDSAPNALLINFLWQLQMNCESDRELIDGGKAA